MYIPVQLSYGWDWTAHLCSFLYKHWHSTTEIWAQTASHHYRTCSHLCTIPLSLTTHFACNFGNKYILGIKYNIQWYHVKICIHTITVCVCTHMMFSVIHTEREIYKYLYQIRQDNCWCIIVLYIKSIMYYHYQPCILYLLYAGVCRV